MSAREAGIRSPLLPQALGDYLRLLAGAVVGFGILTGLIVWLTPVDALYLLPAFALLFSVQAASYSVQLARDPDFAVPGCGCGADVPDDTATVLRSPEGRLLGVPNPFVGIVLYTALLGAVALDARAAVVALVVVAGLASVYLGYAMVVRLQSVCSLCVNVAALNLLLLVSLAL